MAVTSTNTNLSMHKQEDEVFSVTVSPAQDITGWNFKFTVLQDYAATTALVSKTSGSGISITLASAGTLTVTVVKADTASLTPRAYVYQLRRTDSGSESVIQWGTFVLLPPQAI